MQHLLRRTLVLPVILFSYLYPHNHLNHMNPGSVICICGAGTMGSGIAQASAASGFYTILYELNDAVLEKAKTSIEKNLQSLVEKRKITGNAKEETLNNLQFHQ